MYPLTIEVVEQNLNKSDFELYIWSMTFVSNFGFKMSEFLLILSLTFDILSNQSKKDNITFMSA